MEDTPTPGGEETTPSSPPPKPKKKRSVLDLLQNLVRNRRDHRALRRRKVVKATKRRANPHKHARSNAHKGQKGHAHGS